jgi:hypothetical protein
MWQSIIIPQPDPARRTALWTTSNMMSQPGTWLSDETMASQLQDAADALREGVFLTAM